jgi:hypothetical protein
VIRAFTPRRRWLLPGLRGAVTAFWADRIEDILIDGSSCTEKLDPGDVDGYRVEPDDDGVYDRIDPYWIDFEMILVTQIRKWKWRMGRITAWSFHPSRHAGDRDGRVSGVFPAGPGRCVRRRNSGNQVGIIMIKSDAQRERTAAQIEGFRQALTKVDREMNGRRGIAVRGSYEGMIRQLEDELREADQQ